MDVTAKLGAKSASLTLPSESACIADLHAAIRQAFALGDDALLRVLIKGKALSGDNNAALAAATPRVSSGAKLMVMVTKAEERNEVVEAKPERMRGFEDDDARQRDGGVGGPSTVAAYRTSAQTDRFRFHATAALPALPPGATPSVAAAEATLRELASDRAILAILKEHQWSVGSLKEMPPEGQVGVSASCLMGLNRNRGQTILLRLRTDRWDGIRPYQTLIEVLLHELTHNVHDDHDAKFKALNSQLNAEYRRHARALQGQAIEGAAGRAPARAAEAPAAAVDEGHVLGGGEGGAPSLSARDAAAAASAARAAAAEAKAARARVAADPSWASSLCACGVCLLPGRNECGVCVAAAEEPIPFNPKLSPRLNRGREYTHVVRRAEAGQPLLELLAQRYSHADREAWAAHLAAGRVSVDGDGVADGGLALREGSRVVYHRSPWEEPAADVAGLRTLHDDGTLVVLHKPSGLPVLPSELYYEHTVLNTLLRGEGRAARRRRTPPTASAWARVACCCVAWAPRRAPPSAAPLSRER